MLSRLYAWLFRLPLSTISFVLGSKELIRKRMVLTVPLTVWATAFYQLSPLIIKFQIDTLTDGWTDILGMDFGSVLNVFLVFTALAVGLEFLDRCLQYFRDIALYKLKQETQVALENDFTDHLKTFDGAFLSGENNLRIVRSLQNNLDGVQERLVDFLAKSVEGLTGVVALLVIIPLIHPWLLLVIVLTAIADLGIDALQNLRWRQQELLEQRQREQRFELKWRYTSLFNVFLQNNWFNQIYNMYDVRRKNHMMTLLNQRMTDARFQLFRNIVRSIMYGVATLLAGWLVLQGEIALGTFVILFQYIGRIQSQLKLVGEVFRIYFESRFDLFRFDFLLHLKPKLDRSDISNYAGEDVESIHIKALEFTYPSFFKEEKAYISEMQHRLGLTTESQQKNAFLKMLDKAIRKSLSTRKNNSIKKELDQLKNLMEDKDKKPVLQEVNVEFNKGNIYGLIGYNGAGKTTLMKLIKRSLDVSSGAIEINGRDIKHLDPLSWKSAFASLEQTSHLVPSLSIRENMQLGFLEEIDEQVVQKVVTELGLDTAIQDIDAIVGEGVELSGGQTQLLEVARVLIQKKPIIILDEGTNQMDAEKEHHVLNVLQEYKKDAIILFISHRMTTIKQCDQVIMLEKGKVSGIDSPQNLLATKKKNLFKHFWELQVK